MKPAAFEYHSPRTIEEAVHLLARYAPSDARILAGGQSLTPTMAFRLAKPAHLIDINQVTDFDPVTENGETLVVGALARHEAFARGAVSGSLGALMAYVAHHIAHRPVRTRGTFCGSLAQADPASEWCLLATTLDARAHVASLRGERTVSIHDFLVGVMATALEPDEILTRISIERPQAGNRFGFSEFSRRAGDFALAMALVAFELDRGTMRDVRVGLGAVEERPRRLTLIENMLEGRIAAPAIFAEAAQAAAGEIQPLQDQQADATSRRDLASTMIRRALTRALNGAA